MLTLELVSTNPLTRTVIFTDDGSLLDYPEAIGLYTAVSALGTTVVGSDGSFVFSSDGYYTVSLRALTVEGVLLATSPARYVRVTWNAEQRLLERQLAVFTRQPTCRVVPDYLRLQASLDYAYTRFAASDPFGFERTLNSLPNG